jgi:hypothetical protein
VNLRESGYGGGFGGFNLERWEVIGMPQCTELEKGPYCCWGQGTVGEQMWLQK